MNPAALRFLLVDASDAARRTTRALLADLGCRAVDEACGGASALARLKAQRFDLVIAAAAMPGVSGFDLLHAVRSDATLRYLPVLLIVAGDCKQASVRAVQGGAAGYLVAPVGCTALERALRAIMSQRNAPDAGALPSAA